VEASASLSLNVRAPFAIEAADVSPGQVAPGGAVTLTWTTSGAERATLTDGATGTVSDVQPNASLVVHPSKTTVYTLTAYNKAGRKPESTTARMTARVNIPPVVTDFVATPPSIKQGEATTLTWKGNAVSYAITAVPAGGTPTNFNVGPLRSLLVRPGVDTAYTLNAVSPGGTLTNPPTITVPVQSNPATALAYTQPTAGALQLVADCAPTSCTVRLVAMASVGLRGLALDLPLDTTKVSFDPGSFVKGAPLAAAESAATMGTGMLRNVLVVGLALKGSGTAVAPDVTVNQGDELARFALALLPSAGQGVVFDGAARGTGYKAVIQSSSGRSASAIGVGKLEAR
jgi:hypothetical protein